MLPFPLSRSAAFPFSRLLTFPLTHSPTHALTHFASLPLSCLELILLDRRCPTPRATVPIRFVDKMRLRQLTTVLILGNGRTRRAGRMNFDNKPDRHACDNGRTMNRV